MSSSARVTRAASARPSSRSPRVPYTYHRPPAANLAVPATLPTGLDVSSGEVQGRNRFFLWELHALIGQSQASRWSDDGTSFIIIDKPRFMKEQTFCRSHDWSALHRQLSEYAFKKLNHASRNQEADSDQPIFGHPSFRRDSPEEHLKRPKATWKMEGGRDHSTASTTPLSRAVSLTSSTPEPDRLAMLEDAIALLTERCHALETEISELKSNHGRLYDSVRKIWGKLFGRNQPFDKTGLEPSTAWNDASLSTTATAALPPTQAPPAIFITHPMHNPTIGQVPYPSDPGPYGMTDDMAMESSSLRTQPPSGPSYRNDFYSYSQ